MGLLSLSISAQDRGAWGESTEGLPFRRYDNAADARKYLIGNYRMNLLTHPDGIYELMSGERVWAKFNSKPMSPNTGVNRATISSGRNVTELVGSNSEVAKNRTTIYSGVGFVRYDYVLNDGLKCSRMISVLPSDKVNSGAPCFVLTISFQNTGRGVKKFTYEEAISPNFIPIADQVIPYEDRNFAYPMTTDISFRCLTATFAPTAQKYMPEISTSERSRYELDPQTLFLYAPDAFLVISDGEFKATYYDLRVKSGQKITLNIVIGLSSNDTEVPRLISEDILKLAKDGQYGLFEKQWKAKMPSMANEKMRSRKYEMMMNVHALEAAAVYDEYYEETFIPQERSSAFITGENLLNSSILSCALPACYSNPALAKSSLIYVMKHADHDGRIYMGNTGNGYIPSSYTEQYDAQINLFQLLSEYLRLTGDYGILDEKITVYNNSEMTIMNLVERCFVYLRDEIVRVADNESILRNKSMVISIFPSFASQMKLSGRASDAFVKAVEDYTSKTWESYKNSTATYIEETQSGERRSATLYNYFRSME